MILVLMGVSGVGKTTIGTLLSAPTGWKFEDADDYHSEENCQKMAAGIPLTDADRGAWLHALHERMVQYQQVRQSAILACSALKQQYRELLAAGFAKSKMQLVYLHAPTVLIKARMKSRHHPCMNPGLLDSQLATLEIPPRGLVHRRSRKSGEVRRRDPCPAARSGCAHSRSGEMMTTDIFKLEGKTAVVIGGTSGIGRTLSLGLADAGADVVASARRQDHIEETAAEIERRGRRTLRLCSDVCNRASLEQLLAASLRGFGKIDILVNCAGKIKRMPTLTMPEEEWADIVDTNLAGTLRACQIFGKHMLERGCGRIINIASLNSFVALSEVAAYAASKAGVVSLTRSLAVEWSKQGVLVNAIAPGVFRTALNADLLDKTPRGRELLLRTPMGRFGKTEELVGAVVYLSSDAASFVTGQTLVVDGGFLASGVNQ